MEKSVIDQRNHCMNVGFVTNNFSSGGAQKMMAFVVRSLAPCADKIFLITTQQGNIYSFPGNVQQIYIGDFIKKGKGFFGKINELNNIAKKTREIVVRENIDILCAFGYYFTTVAVKAVKSTKCKVIGSERRAPQMISAFNQLMSKYAYKKCDKVVFQLQGARDFYPNIPDNKTAVIPNPFLPSESSFDRNPERKKIIAMAAARLEQEKGFDIGIKAMKKIIEKYPDYKLRIYGDGDFEKLYGQLIDDLKIRPYIEYMGLSSHIIEDIHDVMVFLLPSRSEGIPNILLESMAAGIPCVAADCPPGGPRMLLENDKNGLLVPVENVDATADAVCELIGNAELRNSVAENATKVTERFKPEKIEEMWRQCFITIMDGNN